MNTHGARKRAAAIVNAKRSLYKDCNGGSSGQGSYSINYTIGY